VNDDYQKMNFTQFESYQSACDAIDTLKEDPTNREALTQGIHAINNLQVELHQKHQQQKLYQEVSGEKKEPTDSPEKQSSSESEDDAQKKEMTTPTKGIKPSWIISDIKIAEESDHTDDDSPSPPSFDK